MNGVSAERLPGLLGHELRNPLASAMTGVMLAREMIDADDPRAPVLDGALRDLDRLTSLIDGWLELARAGRAAAATLDVTALVHDVAGRHGAEVVSCAGEHAIRGHRALLERALDNLCENARQAGARTIRIAAQSLGEELSIHVEDDGSGVPREHVERVFAAGWSTRGSAGLGLHAVATTVRAHKGRVRCVPLARGTRFTITLPLADRRPALA